VNGGREKLKCITCPERSLSDGCHHAQAALVPPCLRHLPPHDTNHRQHCPRPASSHNSVLSRKSINYADWQQKHSSLPPPDLASLHRDRYPPIPRSRVPTLSSHISLSLLAFSIPHSSLFYSSLFLCLPTDLTNPLEITWNGAGLSTVSLHLPTYLPTYLPETVSYLTYQKLLGTGTRNVMDILS
jgi:hypothetical protein